MHLVTFERKGSLGEEPTQSALRSCGVSDQPVSSGPVPGVSSLLPGRHLKRHFLWMVQEDHRKKVMADSGR